MESTGSHAEPAADGAALLAEAAAAVRPVADVTIAGGAPPEERTLPRLGATAAEEAT